MNKIYVYLITYYNKNYKGGLIGLYRKLRNIPNPEEALFYVEAESALSAINATKKLPDFDYKLYSGLELVQLDPDIKLYNSLDKFADIISIKTNEGTTLRQVESIDDYVAYDSTTSEITEFTEKARIIKYGTHGH